MSKRIFILLLTVFVFTVMTGALLVRAQVPSATAVTLTDSTFTYRGYLHAETTAATGLYDFHFSLYDAPEGGNQIGQTAVVQGVELVQGLFAVSLDFGSLTAAPHYLEVAVRPSQSAEPFTTLSPRQSLVLGEASSAPAAESVTAVVTHTHSVNPGAFLYDQDSPDITMSIYYGLRWQANSSERAGFYMSRPADWDGQSPVKVRITFALGSSEAGAVNWRMRLNRYTPNSGEWLTNPASRDADQILVFASGPSSLRIYEQTFTLQPQDFNDEPYWAMFFVRGDGTNGETFTDPLYVMGVDVLYQATR